MHEALAMWKVNKEDEMSVAIAVPSSSGEKEYLVGITLLKESIIVIHDCPSFKYRKSCHHVKSALGVYKKHLWWLDLSKKKVVGSRRLLSLSPDWIQIPLPENDEDGVSEDGKHTA